LIKERLIEQKRKEEQYDGDFLMRTTFLLVIAQYPVVKR